MLWLEPKDKYILQKIMERLGRMKERNLRLVQTYMLLIKILQL